MRIYSSLWNADDWATRGGLVKTDWSQAPFSASYRNFNANACITSSPSSCNSNTTTSTSNSWLNEELDNTSLERLKWVQKNYTLILLMCFMISAFGIAIAAKFDQEFDITWGDGRAKILNNGDLLTLSLDKISGSGFQSKNEYLFGKIDMQLKLIPGNSAGTVTAYYLSSQGPTHDEIDFEFLGNLSGDPYTLHTNVFSQGKGNREQQFHLWFDPTADFHTYSITWNPQRIIFYVDGTPIREYKNSESMGVSYPKNQAMRIYSSLWNADDWATRGGLVKTDWSQAPFSASYRNFNANACIPSSPSSCNSNTTTSTSNSWLNEELDNTSQERLKWVQKNYMVVLVICFMISAIGIAIGAKFDQEFDITWGDGRAKILNNGDLLTLSLDKISGSGFQSKNEYLFGKIDMQLKLVSGNSAGTVTAYYLSSQGPTHDEIDFEFLGNLSGDPYTLHTNVFSQGKGNREQQFHLWFDPTADFHTYSITWNPQRIIFYVDGTPIREYKNSESMGVSYPQNQPMRIYSSLWNADDWATRGGLVKTDWSQAPFSASYRNFNANACIPNSPSSCNSNTTTSTSSSWLNEELDNTCQERLKWVQKNYMVYNYCTDSKRFPQGFPADCLQNS
ncbi:hypothetical protein H5410_016422 [Solanum commersonii]|uniref:xyloglucan:xyloglucosyl transferase n=1 Tax=Solanum commersonii TaxID=4109 RepID=A0A9J5ZWC5_SOLCO|nr:hypothetical protein H5410_016422 [Solanum commersonii]